MFNFNQIFFSNNNNNNNSNQELNNLINELEQSQNNEIKFNINKIEKINFILSKTSNNIFGLIFNNPHFLKLFTILNNFLEKKNFTETELIIILDCLYNLIDIQPILLNNNFEKLNSNLMKIYNENDIKIKEKIVKILYVIINNFIKLDFKWVVFILNDINLYFTNSKSTFLIVCKNITKNNNGFNLNENETYELILLCVNLLNFLKNENNLYLIFIEIFLNISMLIKNKKLYFNLDCYDILISHFINNKSNENYYKMFIKIFVNLINVDNGFKKYLEIKNFIYDLNNDKKFNDENLLFLINLFKNETFLIKKYDEIIINLINDNSFEINYLMNLIQILIIEIEYKNYDFLNNLNIQIIFDIINEILKTKKDEKIFDFINNFIEINPNKNFEIFYRSGLLNNNKKFKILIKKNKEIVDKINQSNEEINNIKIDSKIFDFLDEKYFSQNEISTSKILNKILTFLDNNYNEKCILKNIYNNFNNIINKENLNKFFNVLKKLLILYENEFINELNKIKPENFYFKLIYDFSYFETIDKCEIDNLGDFKDLFLDYHKRLKKIKEFFIPMSNKFLIEDINTNFSNIINNHVHLIKKINDEDENPFYIKFTFYYLNDNKKVFINNDDNLNKEINLMLNYENIYFYINYDIKDENYKNNFKENFIDYNNLNCVYVNKKLNDFKYDEIIEKIFNIKYNKIINNIDYYDFKNKDLKIIIYLINLFLFYCKINNFEINNCNIEFVNNYLEKNIFKNKDLKTSLIYNLCKTNYLQKIITFENRLNIFKITFDNRRNFFNLNELQNLNNNNNNNSISLNKNKFKFSVERKKEFENYYKIYTNNSNIFSYNGYIEFDYINEEGKGLGPTNEFYTNFFENFYEKFSNLFIIDNNKFLFPVPNLNLETNEKKIDNLQIFEFLGFVLARCFLDDRNIDFPLSFLFIDVLFDDFINLNDFENLLNLKTLFKEIFNNNNNENIKNLQIYFNLPGFEEIELKENGKNILLSNENKNEYFQLLFNKLFNSNEIIQIKNSFLKGFNKVFDFKNLKLFTSIEIQNNFLTSFFVPWEEKILIENIIPDHGYNYQSSQYKYLIKYLVSLDKNEQKKFLKFTTGCCRLPYGGFKNLKPKLTIVKKICYGIDNEKYLPSVMTCQNYLKVPEYNSYEIFKEKLEYAINESKDMFGLS